MSLPPFRSAPRPTDTFDISFDTKEMPGLITSVQVILDRKIHRRSDFEERFFRVDLCNHPLYAELEAYVLANPSGRTRK